MKKFRFLTLFLVMTFIPIFRISPLAADNDVIKTISATFPNSIGCKTSLRVYNAGVDLGASSSDIYFMDEKKVDSEGNVSFDVVFENITATYKYVLRTSNDESAQGTVVVESEAQEPAKEAYYVLDEDFSMPRPESSDVFTRVAWDLLEGTPTNDYSTSNIWSGGNKGIVLTDTDTSSRVTAQRTFEKLTDSYVIVEMRLEITDSTKDGWGFSLCNGDSETLKGVIQNGGLYFGDTRAAECGSNTTVGVRVELDLAQRFYHVFINGNQASDELPVTANSIDNIRFFTSEEGTGKLYTGPVRIAKDYYVADEFVPYGVGNKLTASSQWVSSGSVEVISSEGTPVGDIYSLAMTDTSASSKTSIQQMLRTELTNEEIITFKVYSPDAYINMLNIDAGDLKAKIEDNKFYIKNENDSYDFICDVPASVWNTFRITASCSKGTAVVQLNGKEKIYNQKFAKVNAALDRLSFETGLDTTDTIWLDDIYVFDVPPVNDDYPEEPAKLQKSESDVLVGIQACDLWHEGKHFGWDKIADYPNRIPYLGLYDDGSPEVKDWEIKWLVEHGIDYSIHCWYRPGNIGTPIKEPRNGYSIHDGYFNAKYKDKLKFAIAWENAGFKLSGSLTEADMLADFKNNIVPFWIEYYFKDPGYLTIDNKIVVNIYAISTLRDALGEAGLIEAVEYLKNEVKKIGYDGIYLIGTTYSSSSATLQEYKDYGYDAVYCYSHGTSNYTFARMQNEIMRQKENGVISYIPTIGMGCDITAWNRQAGGFSTPDAVKQLAKWVKNRYFSNGATGTELGDRMVIIDNWNEFGEGHFFMPSKLGGFGYLEAIGSVFGQPNHTDTRPKNTARLGHLYDQSRIDKVTVRETEYNIFDGLKDTPLIRWDFANSTDGFTGGTGISISCPGSTLQGSSVKQGYLNSYYTKDPIIYSPSDLNISLTGSEVVHVKYRSPLNETNKLQVYFKTDEMSSYSEENSVKVNVPANTANPVSNGVYEDIYVDMSFNANWNGTLNQIRIDPYGFEENLSEKPADFNIDYIEIVSYNTGRYVPSEYRLVCTGFKDSEQNLLNNVPNEVQDGLIEFEYTNPYKESFCKGFVAEYENGKLVNVYYSNESALITGDSSIEIPIKYNPGHEYRASIWDNNMTPLIDVQVLK
ncbi:MAG: glycoside hydrolase family 99-like domain-containing protein [Clostridia bacterium]|nr:glycoside hydrolase family 99-like domain-containing protein [Clostridia bacterium]